MLEQSIHSLINRPLFSLSPDALLSEAISMMDQQHISCVLICQDHKPLGIVTDRDLTHLIAQHTIYASTTVAEVMAHPVISIHDSCSYFDVMEYFREHRIRHLALLNPDGEVSGIVTETDVVNTLETMELLATIPVSDVMSDKAVVSLEPGNSLREAIDQMDSLKIGSIVIADQGKPVGILTESDIPRLLDQGVDLDDRLGAVLSSRIPVIQHSLTSFEALQRLRKEPRHHLVVEDAHGVVVGVLSRSDFTKGLIKQHIENMQGTIERQQQQLYRSQIEMADMRRQASEKKYAGLMEASSDAIIIVDASTGAIMEVNTAAVRLLGFSVDQLLTMRIWQLHPLQDARLAWQEFLTHLRLGGHHDMAMCHIDGHHIDVSVSSSSHKTGAQRLIMATFHDITARKQAESSLRLLTTAIDCTADAIFITDAEARIEYVNPAFERDTGFSRAESVGQFASIIRGDHGDDFYQQMEDTVNRGQIWHGEINIRRADGMLRLTERSLSPVRDASSGNVTHHVIVQRDITDAKQHQVQMEHTQRLESLGVLAGGIAHDFNNILTAILGNAALAKLKAATHPNEMPRYLGNIVESSEKAAELCKQMLAYSGQGPFIVKPINLSSMVREITKLLELSINKHVELKYELTDSLPSVEADVAQMQQVMMNLVINASDAIGDNRGVISLSTGIVQADCAYFKDMCTDENLSAGRYVLLTVSDTGCGMDKQTQQHIFEPFFTTKFTGRGLGMSAVLGIVRGHHGALKLYSEPGHGSIFQLLLPASDQLAIADKQMSDRSDQWHGSGTVLIVDDEDSIRETAAMMLEDIGFNTLVAVDGLNGIEVYRQHQHEIVAVLLDMTMPKLDGKGCFQELRRINGNVQVILSSGYCEQDATSHFTSQGLAGFIQKPYRPEELELKMKGLFQ